MEQPGKSELCGNDIEFGREHTKRGEAIDIATQVVCLETRSVVPEVSRLERGDLTRKEAVSERSPGDDPNAELARRRR